MRIFTLGFALFIGAVFVWADSAEAQSGARSGGSSSVRRSAPSSSSGSRRSASPTISRGSSTRGRGSGSRLSAAERQQIQLRQTLIALGEQSNVEQNQRQNQLAAEEASRDFEILKNQEVSPQRIGSLTSLFRLGENLVDPETQSLNWPEVLSTEEYAKTVAKLNTQVQDRKLSSSKAAKKFLNELSELNHEVNVAAAADELELEQYIEARMFLTGLANEVRATDVLK